MSKRLKSFEFPGNFSVPKSRKGNPNHNILEGPTSLASISMSVSLSGIFCRCVKSLVGLATVLAYR